MAASLVIFVTALAVAAGPASAVLPQCASTRTCTDADLEAQVLSESPGLDSALDAGDTGRAAQLLLEWAAPRIVVSGSTFRTSTVDRGAADIYYTEFAPRTGGAYCFEAADFFNKLLALFGIDSSMLVYGELGGMQHATVVVTVENGPSPVFALFDPTFGAVLRTDGGELASIDDLIHSWGTPAAEDFGLETIDLSARTWLDEPGGAPHSCSEPDHPEITACDLERFLEAFADAFEAAGFSTGQHGFLEFLVVSKWLDTEWWEVPPALVAAQQPVHEAYVSDALARPVSRSRIEGAATVGETLIATPGAFSAPDPIRGYSVEWMRCQASDCTPIESAINWAYTIAETDQGLSLMVRVSASTRWGAGPASTALTPVVSARAVSPTEATLPSALTSPAVVPARLSGIRVSGKQVRFRLSRRATVLLRLKRSRQVVWHRTRRLPAGVTRVTLPTRSLRPGRYRLELAEAGSQVDTRVTLGRTGWRRGG
jgi:hypothetical protein